jgi:hypothetical protein
MGLFTKDEKINILPQSEESKAGSAYLQKLLGQQTPDIPQQQVAGMTAMEKAINSYLPQYLASSGESADMARGIYGDILSGSNYNQQADQLKKDYEWSSAGGLNELRRRANMGGMLDSTNAIGQEQNYLNQGQSTLMNQLNSLREQDTNKKLTAAKGIQDTESQQLQNVAAVGALAKNERDIEQQQNNALYQRLMTQIMFPYQQQAEIANSLLNYKNEYVTTGGGANDLGMILGMAGSALGGFAGTEAGAAALAGI